MLDEALKSLSADPDLVEFGQYFFEYYVKNVKSWAYCYRLHAGVNTNMHIERMHKTLKYIYLLGKSVQRLDKVIHAIMRFLRDKLFDRLIVLNKCKLTNKLKDLRKRHKTSLSMSVSVVQTTEGWNICSQNNDEMYAVTQINIVCQCLLKCENCQACIHQYSCTGLDSSVRWNVCKHIHYICHFNKDKSFLLCQRDNELDIRELSFEKDVIVDELGRRYSPIRIGMNDRREALKLKLNAMVDTLNSEEEIQAFVKNFASVKPTIDAIRLHNAEIPPLPHNKEIIPVNKKIIPQRRLFSTKKKTSNAARR
ncbi:hypothetical protein AVEN_99720-1 [Araneus ventricosus]|uniref:SWIM-type domain-containing protein n=1 Tax=Araneus ventricosus TaxID=182803 RepID=A0A4Y2SII6_ARAVE|nr:hypothetical protein AVEN_99720-1 [Araneus ventricosus]